METVFQITEEILIASVSGDLDHHTAFEARSLIDNTFEAFKCRHIVLDFSAVSFVDSSGIGVVMGRYNKVLEKGGIICICGCSGYMKRILEMAGIFTIIKEYANSIEAVKHIKGESILQAEKEKLK